MKAKLSKAQQGALEKIIGAPVGTPNTVYGWTWKCIEDYTSPSKIICGRECGRHTWKAGMVYGTFNTATLRALETAGLIKIHKVGGAQMPDTIEVLTTA